jgi:hypothetical protein
MLKASRSDVALRTAFDYAEACVPDHVAAAGLRHSRAPAVIHSCPRMTSLTFEQQRREFMETAPPSLPLVGRVWRLVIYTIDARFLPLRYVLFATRAVLAAAIADEFIDNIRHHQAERGCVADHPQQYPNIKMPSNYPTPSCGGSCCDWCFAHRRAPKTRTAPRQRRAEFDPIETLR